MSDFTLHPQLEADSVFVRDLDLCQLRLMNRKVSPWLLLIPRRADMREIYELSPADRARLIEEIAQASQTLDKLYAPDKINVAALGNQVPQLHIHVIARFTHDAAWPNPVWGKIPDELYAPAAIAELIVRLNEPKFWI